MEKTGLKFKILTSIVCIACLLTSVILLNSCGKGTNKLEYTLNSAGTEYSVTGYNGNKENVTIPEEYEGLPVVSVGEQAFKGNETVKKITLPDSIKTIYDEAFADCASLESIELPDSLTSLGYGCFQNCVSLTEVSIPEGVTKLPVALFNGCSALDSVELPASLTDISFVPFIGCDNLSSLKIAEGNTTYHSKDNCIIDTAKKELVVGAGNSVIPSDGSVETIGESAFFGKLTLHTLEIPESVKTVGQYAFYGCANLRYARIAGTTEIEDGAFNGCSSLRYLVLPKSLGNLGESVFGQCRALKNIYYLGSSSEWENVTMDDTTVTLLKDVNVHFYSETKPEAEGNFWHYGSDNTIQTWEKE